MHVFERPYNKHAYKRMHACSQQCQSNMRKKGSRWHELREQSCMKKYGVKSVFNVPGIVQKIVMTNRERYGDAIPMRSSIVKSRYAATNLTRHGVENPLKSPIIEARRRETNLRRYGCVSPMQNSEVKRKSRDTCMKRYGVKSPLSLRSVREKALRKIKDRRDVTGFDSIEEYNFYVRLVESFDCQVCRQVLIPGTLWPADFYLPACDVYIQYDGIYWHGLDRDIKSLISERHDNPQSRVRLKNYIRDRRQEQYCQQNNIKLIRVRSDDHDAGLEELGTYLT